mmetsp:Transcript_4354/g.11981  ORF Transcript_4354/g.11981 Transcript_4354/m.11981 type:complete len:216 (+) Transcript_4354:1341-1988(+)
MRLKLPCDPIADMCSLAVSHLCSLTQRFTYMFMKWCCVVAFSKTSCMMTGMPLFGRADCETREMIWSDSRLNFSTVSLLSTALISRTKSSSPIAAASGVLTFFSSFHFLACATHDVLLTCRVLLAVASPCRLLSPARGSERLPVRPPLPAAPSRLLSASSSAMQPSWAAMCCSQEGAGLNSADAGSVRQRGSASFSLLSSVPSACRRAATRRRSV